MQPKKQEKNGRYSCYPFEDSKQEAKNKNFSKENVVSPRERHVSPRGRNIERMASSETKEISSKAHQNPKENDAET